MKRILAALAVAASASTLSLAVAAPALAASPYPGGPVYLFGYVPPTDGISGPSHDPSLAVIPICQGPAAVGAWLNANFSNHGADIQAYLNRNGQTLTNLAKGTVNPITGLFSVSQAIIEIPVYAANDSLFHLPATAISIISLCGTIKAGNLNATVPAA